jgi:hypothetical protein
MKSRGIGDCLNIQESVWDGQTFKLLSRVSTGLCKGFIGSAWKLPSYRAKVQVKKAIQTPLKNKAYNKTCTKT